MSKTKQEQVEELVKEIFDAGYILGDNQWSGDIGTLITEAQAVAKINKLLIEELDSAIRQSEIAYTIDVLTKSDRITPIYSEHQPLVEELIIAEGKLIKRLNQLQANIKEGEV